MSTTTLCTQLFSVLWIEPKWSCLVVSHLLVLNGSIILLVFLVYVLLGCKTHYTLILYISKTTLFFDQLSTFSMEKYPLFCVFFNNILYCMPLGMTNNKSSSYFQYSTSFCSTKLSHFPRKTFSNISFNLLSSGVL